MEHRHLQLGPPAPVQLVVDVELHEVFLELALLLLLVGLLGGNSIGLKKLGNFLGAYFGAPLP